MQNAGNPVSVQPSTLVEDRTISLGTNNENLTKQETSDCKHEYLDVDDVNMVGINQLYILAYNITVQSVSSRITVDNVTICFNRSTELKKQIFKLCSKLMYDEDEFSILDNNSALVYNDLLEPGTFKLHKGRLLACIIDNGEDVPPSSADIAIPVSSFDSPNIVMGKVGTSISVIALTAHLITFCLVPSLRNLPGYNLASLSLAFLIGYSFVLIGQIPEVRGLFCSVSAILQQNFLLAAFFCMNVMAFDVWRTLKMATTKLATSSHNKKRTQFIFYSIYSWGMPLIITTISVVLDYTEDVPTWIKPGYGKKDTCWITSIMAKTIFFSIPAFSLFLANGAFFIMSAFIIKNNTMNSVSDQQRQTARLNFVLYVRLGLMMGVTWLLGIIATISDSNDLWLISDLLNSLQGLFVFLLFTCSRKVFKHIRERVSLRTPKSSTCDNKTLSSTDKQVTN
ncbi:g-protein coupled receptor Mth2 [Trichonephila clavipes]|uniref:G-protein coupled receptor Mth2 n=1 Tax=Trichonephila clavipes TaxID=2585209 RepID=A0A8X6VY91_TRICX|nr:g-protein coupled receptor Mth2 [Trichonephila clavipes]